ncbi:GPW/gp25 family protein [Candidatus Pacearchaeota archaeon]|nr:GPW/gp25 family protein [Candidatus Pacearchaeota archaeon]
MSATLQRFHENVLGTKDEVADFSSVITPKGDFKRSTGLQVILRSWNNILNTPLRTASHDPDYGSELYKYVFEPLDDYTRKAIEDEVRIRLITYDNRARITSITVNFLQDGKGFLVSVEAEYKGEKGELSVEVDESSVPQ